MSVKVTPRPQQGLIRLNRTFTDYRTKDNWFIGDRVELFDQLFVVYYNNDSFIISGVNPDFQNADEKAIKEDILLLEKFKDRNEACGVILDLKGKSIGYAFQLLCNSKIAKEHRLILLNHNQKDVDLFSNFDAAKTLDEGLSKLSKSPLTLMPTFGMYDSLRFVARRQIDLSRIPYEKVILSSNSFGYGEFFKGDLEKLPKRSEIFLMLVLNREHTIDVIDSKVIEQLKILERTVEASNGALVLSSKFIPYVEALQKKSLPAFADEDLAHNILIKQINSPMIKIPEGKSWRFFKRPEYNASLADKGVKIFTVVPFDRESPGQYLIEKGDLKTNLRSDLSLMRDETIVVDLSRSNLNNAEGLINKTFIREIKLGFRDNLNFAICVNGSLQKKQVEVIEDVKGRVFTDINDAYMYLAPPMQVPEGGWRHFIEPEIRGNVAFIGRKNPRSFDSGRQLNDLPSLLNRNLLKAKKVVLIMNVEAYKKEFENLKREIKKTEDFLITSDDSGVREYAINVLPDMRVCANEKEAFIFATRVVKKKPQEFKNLSLSTKTPYDVNEPILLQVKRNKLFDVADAFAVDEKRYDEIRKSIIGEISALTSTNQVILEIPPEVKSLGDDMDLSLSLITNALNLMFICNNQEITKTLRESFGMYNGFRVFKSYEEIPPEIVAKTSKT